MKRREFIALAGSAAVWPGVARAQQAKRMQRVSLLFNTGINDPETTKRLELFRREIAARGWIEGKNLHIDFRGVETARQEQFESYSKALVNLAPDVLVAGNAPALRSMLSETKIIPIVFVNVDEPVGAGFVDSLARPGGNITGFAKNENSVIAKVFQTLLDLAPGTTRVMAAFVPSNAGVELGQKEFLVDAARSLGVELIVVSVRDLDDFEAQLALFARGEHGGVIMPAFTADYERLAALAAHYRVPAIYQSRIYIAGGGLISYAPDIRYQWGQAATYVDRLLHGARASELPIQLPTKYELVINRSAAKSLGLDIPSMLLARADEVIE